MANLMFPHSYHASELSLFAIPKSILASRSQRMPTQISIKSTVADPAMSKLYSQSIPAKAQLARHV